VSSRRSRIPNLMMSLMSILVGVLSFIISLLLLQYFEVEIFHTLFLPIIIGILLGIISIGLNLIYPILAATSKRGKIDSNLTAIANFMSVLAASGMPPGSIIRSLARVGDEFHVGEEARLIIRDIELMGLDIRTALKNASNRSPSKRFASLLDGIIATTYVGGDLSSYLREQSEKYKNMKMLAMKNFLDNLGIIAEIYATFLVAAPIMLIVMLSVMSFIGGNILIGYLEPRFLLDLLTYVIMPVGVSILILAVEVIAPPK